MVLVFSTTTSRLTDEYVDSFPAERLAVLLFKVAKETGVELSKEKKSVLIRGNWSNLIHAHSELQLYLKREISSDHFSDENASFLYEDSYHFIPEVKKDNKQTLGGGIQQAPKGRKPGCTVNICRFSQQKLPDPYIVYHGKFTSESLSTGKSREAKEHNEKNAVIDNTQALTQMKDNMNMSEDIVKKGTDLDINKTIQAGDSDKPETSTSGSGCLPVKVKEEPDSDLDGSGEDTDIDDSYKQDNGSERNNGECISARVLLDKIKAGNPNIISIKNESEIKNEESVEKDKGKKSIHTKIYHEPNSDGEYSCEKCHYRGKKRSSLLEHFKRMHRETNVLSCDVCKKVFGIRKDLNRHKRRVHANPSFLCKLCGKLYKCRRAYSYHMQIHEDNYVKPNFPCEICGKTFSTKYVLTGHVNSEHLGMKKTFVCPTCGKSFTKKASYLEHANVHAGIKPYICDICGMVQVVLLHLHIYYLYG